MPRTCCIVGCSAFTINGLKNESPLAVFRFPLQDVERSKKWIQAVSRKNWVPTRFSGVCIKHFHPKDISTTNKLDDTLPLKRIRLKRSAVPCIFTKRKYKNNKSNKINEKTLKLNNKKRNKIDCHEEFPGIHRDNGGSIGPSELKKCQRFIVIKHSPKTAGNQAISSDSIQESFDADLIPSFTELIKDLKSHAPDDYYFVVDKEAVILFKLTIENGDVDVINSVSIFKDLTVKMKFRKQEVSPKQYKHILLPSGFCDWWTKFDGLIKLMNKLNDNSVSQPPTTLIKTEETLRVFNSIELHSERCGGFALTLLDIAKVPEKFNVLPIPNQLVKVADSCDKYDLPDSTMPQLILMAGYVAGSIKSIINCSVCRSLLSTNSVMDFEGPNEDISQCLNANGPLTWPTEFTLNLILVSIKIFLCVINEFEDVFLGCEHKDEILFNIVLNKIESSIAMDEHCNKCEEKNLSHVKKCVWVFTSILLNNYMRNAVTDDVKYESDPLDTDLT